jgi:hypothetical protein
MELDAKILYNLWLDAGHICPRSRIQSELFQAVQALQILHFRLFCLTMKLFKVTFYEGQDQLVPADDWIRSEDEVRLLSSDGKIVATFASSAVKGIIVDQEHFTPLRPGTMEFTSACIDDIDWVH